MFVSALFVIRSDTFLESVPEEEKCNFAYRARASDRLQEMGYKITKKFPVSTTFLYKTLPLMDLCTENRDK